MTQIRKPAVAGLFYPAGAAELGEEVGRLLNPVRVASSPPPQALIVPHAGYRFSGPVAAAAYARLRLHRALYRRVVLLGPCHRVPLDGIAASGASAFETPLGRVPLDAAIAKRLAVDGIAVSDAAHRDEHSLEVQLPFLQILLDEFTLVPLVVGAASFDTVARAVDTLWDGADTLVVASSDLSHYLSYDEATRLDHATCRSIERLEPGEIERRGACGLAVIGGLLRVAARRGLAVETVDLKNSGDTAGDRERVVGYGSWILRERTSCEQAA